MGTPLMLVSTPAMATCNMTGPTSQTYSYTAANISQAAPAQFANTWSCYSTNIFGTKTFGNSNNICYRSTFDGTAVNGANSMTYTVGVNDSRNTVTNMVSNTVYGLYTTPVSGTTPLATTFTVTVPAGQATGKAVGTYSDTAVQFAFDEQGNGGACEGNFVSSSDNWDAINPVAYTVNYVVPSVCTLVSTSKVDFGNLASGATIATAGVATTGSVVVNCNANAPYTVYLSDGGQRIAGGSRQMANGSARLPYQLYKSTSYVTSQIWDATGGTGSLGGAGGQGGTGNGLNQSLTVYALIPGGTIVPATTGAYNDTVLVTVTY
ncbi:spore coat protein U domain-containing protein [Rhodanobacter sp. L36]|uniref:Csu type fimbrial protein n=1 Tax=Rhodanobacter sp. L36 TaxID=1747221 RepID=UPI001C20BF12|nr:spore coat protein U domain-containing protein [Rhodanobacter sp. L36]